MKHFREKYKHVSCNIESEINKRTESSQDSVMQVDDSTDVAMFLFCLRVSDALYNNEAESKCLCAKPLPVHNTGEDVFNLIDLHMAGSRVLIFAQMAHGRWFRNTWFNGTR
jgi:hypothetical protein